jgi:hypothetical protein
MGDELLNSADTFLTMNSDYSTNYSTWLIQNWLTERWWQILLGLLVAFFVITLILNAVGKINWYWKPKEASKTNLVVA